MDREDPWKDIVIVGNKSGAENDSIPHPNDTVTHKVGTTT
jgi:hypothetical protein